MGTFLFKWTHPAEEVFITGTFDNWSRSIELKKENGYFARQVDLPSADTRYLYKFVVDGKWTTDHTAPTEDDASGNHNNVLTPADITKLPAGGRSSHGAHSEPNIASTFIGGVAPGASTVQKAGEVPMEDNSDSQMPGSFPEPTPTQEGTTPYIALFPGDMVPDYSTYFSATQPSRKSGSDSFTAREPSNEQSYGVNPIPATPGYGNPVSLKPGESVPDASTVTSNNLQSNVKTDKESYENSGSGLATAGAAGLGAVGVGGLLSQGSNAFSVPPVSKSNIPESSLPMGSGTEPVEKDQGPIISSTGGPNTSTAALAGQVPIEPRGVPEVVKESQEDANAAPEASASQSAVDDKQQVEAELKSVVPEEKAASENTGGLTGAAIGAATGGAALLGGAAAYAFSKFSGTSSSTKDESDGVPQVVEDSQNKAHASPEASANPEAVSEKQEVENEFMSKVPKEKATSENSAGITDAAMGAAAGGAAAIGGAAVWASQKAGAPQSIQDKISSMSEGTKSPADDVPRPVAESYERSSQDPEAAANPEAVREKAAMESSLKSAVPRAEEAGEPAPSYTAAHSATAPGAGSTGMSTLHHQSGAPSSSAIASQTGAPFSTLGEGTNDSVIVPSEPPRLDDEDTMPAIEMATRNGAPVTETAASHGFDTFPSNRTEPSADSSSRATTAAAVAGGAGIVGLAGAGGYGAYKAHEGQTSTAETGGIGGEPTTPLTPAPGTYATELREPTTTATTVPQDSTPARTIADRVFGAPAATTTAGGAAGAATGAAAAAPIAESSKSTATPATASNQASSSVFANDPISAVGSSAPAMTSTTSSLDPRTVASAFANDPLSPSDDPSGGARIVEVPPGTAGAAPAGTHPTGATGTKLAEGAGVAGAAGAVGAATIAMGGSSTTASRSANVPTSTATSTGLNAPAGAPAQSLATKAAQVANTENIKPQPSTDVSPTSAVQTNKPFAMGSTSNATGPVGASTTSSGAMASAVGSSSRPREDSRDISPFSGSRNPDGTTATTSSPTSALGKHKKGAKSEGGILGTGTLRGNDSGTTAESKKEKRKSKMGSWFSEHFGSERKAKK